MRILSLLPSATEMVCALGLQESLVGVTHACDYPNGVSSLPQVTRSRISNQASSDEIDLAVRSQIESGAGLYELDQHLLRDLRPDLVITQTLCEVCAVSMDDVRAATEGLAHHPEILSIEPTSLSEMLQCIQRIGNAANCEAVAREVVRAFQDRINLVKFRSQCVSERPSVILLEWIDPPFSSGHWNPELVRIAGGVELIGKEHEKSAAVDWKDILRLDPDVLFLACCGMDIDRAIEDLPILVRYEGFRDMKCVQNGRVYVADGSAYFNRPGPRLVDSLEILGHALHDELHPLHSSGEKALRVTRVK